MSDPSADGLFDPAMWRPALEKFAETTQLTVCLFDADGRGVLAPVHPTPLFRLFDESGYDPGIFAECARLCIAQTGERPAVLVSQFYGLTAVGASLVLEGRVVGAAVGGYALIDFSQVSEIQTLARQAGFSFERVWAIARQQAPVPQRRLRVNGELLQALGDTLLRENLRTRDLSVQLSDMRRLHELSQQLLQRDDLGDVLRDLLAAAAELLHVEKGSVQICERRGQVLQFVDAIGFDREFADRFQTVGADGFTTCAAAFRQRRRVVVEDLAADPDFAELCEAARPYGIRAAQSTPLLDRRGGVVAMLTTYFDRPHRLSEHELRLLDLYVESAAGQIERQRAEARQQLLINELNHRVKNTLSIVHSLALQTLSDDAPPAAGRALFEARLVALAKAHDVLTLEHWEGAAVARIVGDAIEPYAGGADQARFRVAGPFVRVQPRAALALSMALHELATNAVKYGALSNGAGSVEIGWHIVPGERQRFQLRWAESGGPPVAAPRRRGFGTRLIERGLAQDTGGEARLSFAPEGVICTIEAPLDGIRGA